jgi:lipocalin
MHEAKHVQNSKCSRVSVSFFGWKPFHKTADKYYAIMHSKRAGKYFLHFEINVVRIIILVTK